MNIRVSRRAWFFSLSLGVVGLSILALAVQGRWLLAGAAILTVLALGMAAGNMLLLAIRNELAITRKELDSSVGDLQKALNSSEKRLGEQGKALIKVAGEIRNIDKNENRRRALLEDKLWSAAIPLPKLSPQAEYQGYLAAVVIVKDEGSYLREWLEFHRLVGVEHVFLYDNCSTDHTEEVLADFLRTNYVTRLSWSTFVRNSNPQILAYAHALSNFGQSWRWMALIDADEFLFPTEAENLASALMRYEHLPALAVYWHTFGSSGHEKRPPGLVIENFTVRAPFPPEAGVNPDLLNFKSIVDPLRIRAIVTPEAVKLDNEFVGAYNEDGVLVPAGAERRRYACSRCLRLNHYYTKSQEELTNKFSRGSASGEPLEIRREKMSERAQFAELNMIEDKTIQRFLPELRGAMARNQRSKF